MRSICRVLGFALLTAALTPAQAPWTGHWAATVSVPIMGDMEVSVFLAEGREHPVEGLVQTNESFAPVTGTVAEDGTLQLTIHAPGKPGRATLKLVDGRLAGELKPAGMQIHVKASGSRVGRVPAGTPLGLYVVPEDIERPITVGRTSLDDLEAELVDRALHKFMEGKQVVGMSFALAKNGVVTDTRSYGWADHRSRKPVLPTTMFRWASIAKPLSATVALRLAERGLLDLDADVRKLVPEFPEKRDTVTLRHILCHQSGITHYQGAVRTRREHESDHAYVDMVTALDMFKETRLKFRPGTRYSYSTHAWTLLAACAERATGRPFAALIQKHVAASAGMTNVRPDYSWEQIPRKTEGYHRSAGRLVQSVTDDISWKLPGGGLISTAEDLARFGAALHSGRLLQQDTLAAMTTEQKTSKGEGTGCGLGIRVGTRDGHLLWSHTGSQTQTATVLLVDPKAQLVVALMANTHRAPVRTVGLELLEALRNQEGRDR